MNNNSNDGGDVQTEKGDAGVEDRTAPKVQSELEDKKLDTSLHRSLHEASCHRAATATAAATADAVAAAKDHLRNTGDDFTLGAWAVIENGNDISVTPRGAVERSVYNRAFQEMEDGMSVDSGIDFFEDMDLQYEDGETASKDGLARAFKVEDDDEIDPMHLPAGLEFDPDAKPPELIHRENLYRTIRFYSIFVAVTIVIVVLGGVAGMQLQRSVPDALPDRAVMGIREYVVEQLLSAEDAEIVLKDPTNPYRRALDWIQSNDAMALTPQNGTKFTQRFLAAYFYFSTSVDGPWTSGCAPASGEYAINDVIGDGIRRHRQIQDNSCVHTVKVSTERIDDIVTAASRWLSSDDECLWGGVLCDEVGHIFSIDLSTFLAEYERHGRTCFQAELAFSDIRIVADGSNMTGAIPEGIAGLTFLKRLSVALGALTGPLPSVLGNMKHLSFVDLASNLFAC
jgi:hypothetical protein